MDETTYFAIIYTGMDFPDLEAVNGGKWDGDVYQFVFEACEMRLIKGITIFDSPEEALDAALAKVYKELDIDITTLKGNCQYMKKMGEQLHDPNICASGYTPYDKVIESTTVLPVHFAKAAAAIQRYVIQYAHLLEIAYL